MKFNNSINLAAVNLVAPVRERGLKYHYSKRCWRSLCRSRKGAWIEMSSLTARSNNLLVAPVRERGLKYHTSLENGQTTNGRSRKGAWIEIVWPTNDRPKQKVAPVRERGLKCYDERS